MAGRRGPGREVDQDATPPQTSRSARSSPSGTVLTTASPSVDQHLRHYLDIDSAPDPDAHTGWVYPTTTSTSRGAASHD
ncbi:MAG: hypothetical protein L0K86_24665 [Actinomycetia bacterium]|nr:hypothetical protein [Actinomycetes bacterium]